MDQALVETQTVILQDECVLLHVKKTKTYQMWGYPKMEYEHSLLLPTKLRATPAP